MSSIDFIQNYNNYQYMNELSQMNRNFSPYKEDRNNQFNGYINKEPFQNGYNNYNNFNTFGYYSTPKKGVNLYEPDTLFSPMNSNSKVDLSNNQLLTNRKKSYLNESTPFKKMVNNINSPFVNKM